MIVARKLRGKSKKRESQEGRATDSVMNSVPVSDDPYIVHYKSTSINSAKAKNKNKNKLKFDLLPITKRQNFAM